MPATLTTEIQSVLDTFKQGAQEIYGSRLKGLILFGSQARGDAGPDSDVDIAVILEGPIDHGEETLRTGKLRARINLDTQHLVSCLYLTPERLRDGQRLIFRNIRSEGVPL